VPSSCDQSSNEEDRIDEVTSLTNQRENNCNNNNKKKKMKKERRGASLVGINDRYPRCVSR